MIEHVRGALTEARSALDHLLQDQPTLNKIAQAGQLIGQTFQAGGRVYSCGNGGSMCDALHFAEELTGRFRKDRPGLPALAIGDGAHLTCVGNDFGFEAVFSRFIEAHGKGGDVILGISTSGKSPNVIKAAEAARQRGLKVITLTGKPESPLGRLADIDICTPGGRFADRVQELHIKVIHILIELVERRMFGETYS